MILGFKEYSNINDIITLNWSIDQNKVITISIEEKDMPKFTVSRFLDENAIKTYVGKVAEMMGIDKNSEGKYLFSRIYNTSGTNRDTIAGILAKIVAFDYILVDYPINYNCQIGYANGYLGFDDGGQLCDKVRRNPYSVVLFDEIEKAHPDVFNILLQVLDDGRLTDNKGRTVNFKNTIIIMTSNLGSDYIRERSAHIGDTQKAREAWLEETGRHLFEMLKQTIRPEFLNRIDETVVFTPLSKPEIQRIVRLQADGVVRMLADNGIRLTVDDSAIALIADAGFDPEFGARPLKRAIQKYIEDPLAEAIISEKRPTASDGGNGQLIFT